MVSAINEAPGILRRAKELANFIRAKTLKLREEELARDREIQEVLDKKQPSIDALRQEINQAVQELVSLVMPVQRFMTLVTHGTQTVPLGELLLSLRHGPTALEITNNKALIEELRRLRKIRGYTRRGKLEPDKDAIKRDENLLAQLKHAHVVRRLFLDIELVRAIEDNAEHTAPISIEVKEG